MNGDGPVRLRIENRVAHIILDKPPENRMNQAFLESMCSAVYSLLQAEDLGAVVIYGSGRHFSAGADVDYVKSSVLNPLNERQEVSQISKKSILSPNQSLRELEKLEIPTIAAVNGLCMGSGLEIALACDIRICASNAIMGSPELSWGIITGLGGSFRLERLIGKAGAKEMILKGDVITGQEAYNIGLANQVMDRKQVVPYALKQANLLSQRERCGLNASIKRTLMPC